MAAPSPASACAVVSASTHRAAAALRIEEALIVWDEAHQTEHFIRNAMFDTNADSIGLLVPTPTPPALGEASDSVFSVLERITAPHVERRAARA